MSHNGDRNSDYARAQSGRAPAGRVRAGRQPGFRAGTGSNGLRIFRWIAVGLAVGLVVVSTTAYLAFRSVWDSITRVPVTGLGPVPPSPAGGMNILLIGSDSRSGPNKRFGAGIAGQRSDTIIVLHIEPHRAGVIALSIPRDSVVPVLSCPPEAGAPGQPAQPGQVEQINATFASGGPGCLWKTIEETTHLRLDHFIELNFTGFEKVINDVGGVSICLPFAIDDPDSKLRLVSGRHHVDGAEALAFWRARYIGEGSDLQRIRRDQYLLVSLLQGAEHAGLASSPSRFLSVVTDAASSMTTDSGLSLPIMLGIADSLRGLPPGKAQFIELPTQEYRPNPNWVTWPPSDAALLRAIALGQAVRPAAKVLAKPGAPARGASAHDPRTRSGHQADLADSYGGITGGTDVCHDGAAFAGPLGGS